jgi:hypothetical protein
LAYSLLETAYSDCFAVYSAITYGVTATTYTISSFASVEGAVSTLGMVSTLGSGTTVFASGASGVYCCLCEFLAF